VGNQAARAVASTYILVRIDIDKAAHIVETAQPAWVALAALLALPMTLPMAWRWRLLLRARGIREGTLWLARAYYVGFAVGQVLPTCVGGDGSRIFETVRRHPGKGSPIAGSVLLGRRLGTVITVLLALIGSLLAIGRYSIGAYLWIETRSPRIRRGPRLSQPWPDYRHRLADHALRPISRHRVDRCRWQSRRHPRFGDGVCRTRAAALPDHARPIHNQRPRRARGVLSSVSSASLVSILTPRSPVASSSS
jgi:Lysylphosphatidylglycerol synthase TM region